MASREQSMEWLHISDDESLEWLGHPSFYPTAGALIGFIVLSIICIVLAFLLAIGSLGLGLPPVMTLGPIGVVALFVIAMLWKYYVWKSTYYAITSTEIYKKKGIIGRDVTTTGYGQVQNINYSQSVVERLLSFSDISIYTAGTNTSEMRLENTPNPENVQKCILDNMQGKSEPGVQNAQDDGQSQKQAAETTDTTETTNSDSSSSGSSSSNDGVDNNLTDSKIYD